MMILVDFSKVPGRSKRVSLDPTAATAAVGRVWEATRITPQVPEDGEQGSSRGGGKSHRRCEDGSSKSGFGTKSSSKFTMESRQQQLVCTSVSLRIHKA